MNRRVFRRGFVASFFFSLRPIIFTLIVISMIFAGLRYTEESNRAEGLRLLEEAILRAVIHSYALEGRFPGSLDHIADNYGIYIDKTRFLVHYEAFAENILPDIRVFDISR